MPEARGFADKSAAAAPETEVKLAPKAASSPAPHRPRNVSAAPRPAAPKALASKAANRGMFASRRDRRVAYRIAPRPFSVAYIPLSAGYDVGYVPAVRFLVHGVAY